MAWDNYNIQRFANWAWNMPEATIKTKTKILNRDTLFDGTSEDAWGDIAYLYVLCALSGEKEAGDDLLQAFFGACPIMSTDSPHFLQELELIWHYSGARPVKLPWEDATSPDKEAKVRAIIEKAKKPEYDISNPGFFQLNSWTATDWIFNSNFREGPKLENFNKETFRHSWRESSDPWIHVICPRLLCHVSEGELPTREAIEEAFEALEKLFTELPKLSMGPGLDATQPHSHIFPLNIYFLLAVNLGKRQAARDAIAVASTKEEWNLPNFLGLPALYELVFDTTIEPNNSTTPLDPAEARRAVATLKEALILRKQKGGKIDPFVGMSWPDLLRRFSEVAFKTELGGEKGEEEDDETEERPESSSDLLLPALTPEEIAAAEAELGPIPQDIKDMSLVSRGFKGGWHFAGGGFPGIQDLWKEDTDDHLYNLEEIEPEARYETRTEQMPDGTSQTRIVGIIEIGVGAPKEGPPGDDYCWVGNGTVHNDDFIHVIIPPEVWKRIRNGQVKEGEYRIFSYSHWTDGAHGEYHSMRDWIVDLTKSMEEAAELDNWRSAKE
ncbi:hypothetical protein GQ53DRAFT_745889 [Thozetella sp. PMI_491]|nr:hypothetical protein GQ53DRAFT_745889 [Thozetella sp. PMI_491]